MASTIPCFILTIGLYQIGVSVKLVTPHIYTYIHSYQISLLVRKESFFFFLFYSLITKLNELKTIHICIYIIYIHILLKRDIRPFVTERKKKGRKETK